MSLSMAASRGGPLKFFAVIMGLWLGGRFALWQSPFADHLGPILRGVLPEEIAPLLSPSEIEDMGNGEGEVGGNSPFIAEGSFAEEAMPSYSSAMKDLAIAPVSPAASSGMQGKSAGHQLLWLAAMKADAGMKGGGAAALMQQRWANPSLNSPAGLKSSARGFVPFPQSSASKRHLGLSSASKWSGDAWLYYRPSFMAENRAASAIGQSNAVYGASQAGGVLRYKLTAKTHVYARSNAALSGFKASLSGFDGVETAFGASFRPLKALPVRFYGEMRHSEVAGKSALRPSAFAVSELPPISLPLKASAEAYAQAGYVGGKGDSAFADGQMKITREVAQFSLAKIRLGGGVWGGAQKGASRLDIGPSIQAETKIGKVPVRISLDYRSRIAGGAAPQSGAALTISTGF